MAELIEEREHAATADGLTDFIDETCGLSVADIKKEARYTPAIKARTLAEGLQAHRLEKLNRYETHLDRKVASTRVQTRRWRRSLTILKFSDENYFLG